METIKRNAQPIQIIGNTITRNIERESLSNEEFRELLAELEEFLNIIAPRGEGN